VLRKMQRRVAHETDLDFGLTELPSTL